MRQLNLLTAAIGGAFSEDGRALKKFAEDLATLAAGEAPDPEAEAARNRQEHLAALKQLGAQPAA